MSGGQRFSVNGTTAGIFEGSAPMADGLARYMPLRGPGHYEMEQALKAGLTPRCVCVVGGVEFSFDVVSCPDYGASRITGTSIAGNYRGITGT